MILAAMTSPTPGSRVSPSAVAVFKFTHDSVGFDGVLSVCDGTSEFVAEKRSRRSQDAIATASSRSERTKSFIEWDSYWTASPGSLRFGNGFAGNVTFR